MNDLQIQRAAELLQNEFGPEWQTIAGMLGTEGLRKRVGKELTSFIVERHIVVSINNKLKSPCPSR